MNFFKPILPETSNSTTPTTIGSIIGSKLLTGSLIISENIIKVPAIVNITPITNIIKSTLLDVDTIIIS
jgi:hypothetical protein